MYCPRRGGYRLSFSQEKQYTTREKPPVPRILYCPFLPCRLPTAATDIISFTGQQAFEGGRPPCPRCKTSKDVISKGWMQHGSRVATLRNGFCDLTTYWYQCRKCQGYNKSKCRVSVCVLCVFHSGHEYNISHIGRYSS